jgi:plastocyanin
MRIQRVMVGLIWLCMLTDSAAAQYREEAVADGGAITGTVLVAGDIPVLPAQPVFKELGVCGSSTPDERLVAGPGGALRNAVVHLVDIPAGKPIVRDQPVVFDNVKCAFVPHVLAASVGETLEIHNADPFLHDAHAWLGTRTLFNVGILPGHTSRQPLTDAGLVHINCNVRHTWMHAYLFVADNPYHAVTGPDGRFILDQVPPGTYKVRVWHELLGSIEAPVTVESGKTATVNLALPATAPVGPPTEVR